MGIGCLPACFRTTSRRKICANKCQCWDKFSQNQCLLQSQELNEAKVKDAATKSVTEEQIVNRASESELKSEPQPPISGGEKDVTIVEKHVDTVPNNRNDNLALENAINVEEKCVISRYDSSNSVQAHAMKNSQRDLLNADEKCVDLNSKNIIADGFKPIWATEGCVEPEESSESLFSLSIDSRRQVYATEAEVGEKEVMSPFKPPADIQTVALNPNSVDKRNPQIKREEDKENMEVNSLRIKPDCVQIKSVDNGIAADTSLSSWLVESHKLTKKVDESPESEKNYGNRRMLQEIIPLKLEQSKGDTSSTLPTSCGAVGSQPCVGTVVIGRD